MKTVIVNGSPRKNWNTAQLLQEAKKGAKAAGAAVTYVNLYDLLTMNAEPKDYKELYEKKLQDYFAPFHFLNGRVQIIPVCDTLQVKDYSKYDMAGFSETHKREVHDQEFPQKLKLAFQLGAGEKASSI